MFAWNLSLELIHGDVWRAYWSRRDSINMYYQYDDEYQTRAPLNYNVATAIFARLLSKLFQIYISLSHCRKIDSGYLSARSYALLRTFRPYFTKRFLTLIFETLIDTGRNWSRKLRSKNKGLFSHHTLNIKFVNVYITLLSM